MYFKPFRAKKVNAGQFQKVYLSYLPSWCLKTKRTKYLRHDKPGTVSLRRLFLMSGVGPDH